MPKAQIKLIYRQVIDRNTPGDFARNVFNDSYNELLMQMQVYNGANLYTTWHDLKTNVPKAKQNLPYKVAFSIGLYMRDLNNLIPGLHDTLQTVNIRFANYTFDIVASDFKSKAAHCVSLTYESELLTLFEVVGDQLLLSKDASLPDHASTSCDTLMIKMQPNLSIGQYNGWGVGMFNDGRGTYWDVTPVAAQ